jgi:hypothetical protein
MDVHNEWQVRWIRVLYSDFASFTEDQEALIMSEDTFDYIEGFVIINRTGILNNWRTSFKPQDPVQASRFQSDGRVLYCLELTKNFNSDDADTMEQVSSLFPFAPEMLTCDFNSMINNCNIYVSGSYRATI